MTALERLVRAGDLAGAQALLARRDAAKRRAKALPRAKARGATKEERDAALNANTARIREGCVLRAGGVGELCGRPLDPETMEMAHLDGGSGKRRQHQSLENCVMEHPEHHRSLDKLPLAWLPEVTRWAERYGYEVPRRFRKLEALAKVNGAPVRRST